MSMRSFSLFVLVAFNLLSSSTILARRPHLSRRQLTDAFWASRRLQVSQACIDGTEALFDNNPALEEAEEAQIDEYDDFDCDDLTDGCVVDENTFNSTQAYVQACNAAGGTLYEYDTNMKCTITANGQTETFEEQYINVDICVDADDCNADDIGREVEEESNELLDFFEAFVAVFGEDDGVSLSCSAQVVVSNDAGETIFSSRLGESGARSLWTLGGVAVVSWWILAAAFLVI